MSNAKDIKIFVSAHKAVEIPNLDILYPVEVGAANRQSHFFDLRDDQGDNISAKNIMYCELTAQYWAWKNQNADYFGLCHYRRLLSFSHHGRAPYRYTNARGEKLAKELAPERLDEILEKCDLVAPIAEKVYKSVTEQFAESANQRVSDMEKAVEILVEKYPAMSDAAERYMSGDECYFGNIFVMKKELFSEYSAMLFDVLGELEKTVVDIPDRALGYIGERICGIYITYIKNNTPERVFFAQRVDPGYYFDEMFKRKTAYYLLPPGSRRRALVKKALKRG